MVEKSEEKNTWWINHDAVRIIRQLKGLELPKPWTLFAQRNDEFFDLQWALRSRKGAFIEVAGPTPQGYDFIDIKTLDRALHISNIKPLPFLCMGPEKGWSFVYEHKPNFLADARRLPFADLSLGAIFLSWPGGNLIEDFIKEADRTLESGGLLIWQGMGEVSFQNLMEKDFIPRKCNLRMNHRNVISLHIIMQKSLVIKNRS